jgi:hypothetical protein
MTPRNVCARVLAGWLLCSDFALAQPPPAPPSGAPTPSRELEPAVDTSAVPSAPVVARPTPGSEAAGGKGGKSPAQDRLDLDTTQITGNRELPKVLYIVPWKRPDLGDLVGRPPNTLVDEILAPVDRDVFQRENRYYDALKPDATAAAGAGGRETATGQPAAPGSQNPP